jgi:hypothetical protein
MSFDVRGYASPAWRNHPKSSQQRALQHSPLRSDSMYRTLVEIGSFLPLLALLESAHCLSISFHFSCTTYPSPPASPSKRVSSSQNPLHQKKHRHPPTHNSDTILLLSLTIGCLTHQDTTFLPRLLRCCLQVRWIAFPARPEVLEDKRRLDNFL